MGEQRQRVRIIHCLRYNFSEPVQTCTLSAMLSVRDRPQHRVTFAQLVARPEADEHERRQDSFGNQLHMYAFQRQLQRLELTAIHTVELPPAHLALGRTPPDSTPPSPTSPSPTSLSPTPSSLIVSHTREPTDEQRHTDKTAIYVNASSRIELSEILAEYAHACIGTSPPQQSDMFELCRRLRHDIAYRHMPDRTAHPSATEALRSRHGNCEDLAHIAIGCIRTLGLPARYISGYLLPTASHNGKLGTDRMHAWLEVLSPSGGWLGLDPTLGTGTTNQHVSVAVGRDCDDVQPIRGSFTGGGHQRLSSRLRIEHC